MLARSGEPGQRPSTFTPSSGLGDGATHQHNDLPIVAAGSGGRRLKTGGHLDCSGDNNPDTGGLCLEVIAARSSPVRRRPDATSPMSSEIWLDGHLLEY